jgi:hypothetical protein
VDINTAAEAMKLENWTITTKEKTVSMRPVRILSIRQLNQ